MSDLIIDKDAEDAIVKRAFEGIEHTRLATPGEMDRTDFLVSTADLTTWVVEVKDRDAKYQTIVDWGGPLVDSSKVEAVIERAEAMGARGIIIWRTSDGWLIGNDAETIQAQGKQRLFKRRKGNRPRDFRKPIYVVDVGLCYVRPPAPLTNPRPYATVDVLTVQWINWLKGE